MFAELSSEDGEDYVVPRRNRSKIYYSRDQLLALKNSPLVKEPRGMSPASEWFTYAGSISALAYPCITTDIASDCLAPIQTFHCREPSTGL
jgi:hypothetical protein